MINKTLQDKDFEWFLQNYSELFKKYGRKYIVIKNCEVLGIYDSPAIAVNETTKREKLGTFIVQLCNGDESGYTNYIASMNFKDTVE